MFLLYIHIWLDFWNKIKRILTERNRTTITAASSAFTNFLLQKYRSQICIFLLSNRNFLLLISSFVILKENIGTEIHKNKLFGCCRSNRTRRHNPHRKVFWIRWRRFQITFDEKWTSRNWASNELEENINCNSLKITNKEFHHQTHSQASLFVPNRDERWKTISIHHYEAIKKREGGSREYTKVESQFRWTWLLQIYIAGDYWTKNT